MMQNITGSNNLSVHNIYFSSFGLQGSPQRIICLHLALSPVSSAFIPTMSVCPLSQWPQMSPENSISNILCPMHPPSLLNTCPNCCTLTVPLICSFLILSILITPSENLKFWEESKSRKRVVFFFCLSAYTHFYLWMANIYILSLTLPTVILTL